MYGQRVRRWRQGSGPQVAHQEHDTKANCGGVQTCILCFLCRAFAALFEEKQYSETLLLAKPHLLSFQEQN